MRLGPLASVLAAAALLQGCASFACTPVSVLVEGKEERPRLRTESHGIRTDATGRIVEDRRDVMVPEYWVRGQDGRWYDVSEADWKAAEPGRPLSLCR
jgi:hypothetical protein